MSSNRQRTDPARQKVSHHHWLLAGCALSLLSCSEPSYARLKDGASDAPSGEGSDPPSGEASDAAAPDVADAMARESEFPIRDAQTDSGMSDGSRTPTPLVDAARAGNDAAVDAAWIGALYDAAVQTDAAVSTLPSWAEQMVGKYGVQMFAFSDDGNTISQSSGLLIADVARRGAQLEMVTQVCKNVATTYLASITVEQPELWERRRHRMLFSGDTFETDPIDVAEGYEPLPPPDCENKAEMLIPKRAHQKWLGSSCRCGVELIPRADDCRVLDPDGDMLPGFSMRFVTTSGLTELKIYGAQANFSRFVQGRRRGDGALEARLEGKSGALQYGCRPNNCADLSGPTPWCGSEVSSVYFTRLAGHMEPEGGWTCTAITTRQAELFPVLPPPPPSPRCPR
jgi:hypothetical protein